jgi:hypothetical protein
MELQMNNYVKFPVSKTLLNRLNVTEGKFVQLVNSNKPTRELSSQTGASQRTIQEKRQLVKRERQNRKSTPTTTPTSF